MRLPLLLLFACFSLSAQTLTFAIHDNTGATADAPLPASYQFASTPQGSSSSIMLRATNNSQSAVELVLAYVGATPGSPTATPNYTVTGIAVDKVLAPAASEYFTLNFTPSTTGQLPGYLQATYAIRQGSCIFAGSSASGTPCAGVTSAVSTLIGTGTAPQISLTYDQGQGSTSLQPSATAPLDFGSVSLSSSVTVPFTLTNQTSQPLAAPSVSVNAGIFASSAFALDVSALPAILPANSTAVFKVTFSPGQIGVTTAVLSVGSNSYSIEGFGIAVSDIDALQIYYVDSKAVRTSPQAATPISFGQLVPGAGTNNTLTFTVTNPLTSYSAVTLPSLKVSGAGYAIAGGPSLPASLQPGAALTFTVSFNAGASGTYTGSLAIGTRVFSLSALAVMSPVPSISMQLSQNPLVSAQQVQLTIQASSAATQDTIGTIEMQFTPSVSNVADDPAIVFLATGGRKLQVTLSAGSQAATYQGQSGISFQTGTTAGTITFILTFPNTAPLTQTFTITPAIIHLSSALAVRQDPALVITVNGFDNTYTAGKMSFTFFDLKGYPFSPDALPVDATSDFHNYFFINDPAGGSFGMQATFPVTGDITQIGSVAVTLTNSAGQTTTKLSFQ